MKKKNDELNVLELSTIVMGIIFLFLLVYNTIEIVYRELVFVDAESESVSIEKEVFEVTISPTQPVITATPFQSTEDISELYNPLLTHSEVEINSSTGTAITYVTDECQKAYYLSLRALGFTVPEAIIALQIMYLETGCTPDTYQYGDEKVGIMGISTDFCKDSEVYTEQTIKYLKKVLGEYDCSDLADTSLNLYATYLIFSQEGWKSWDTYNEYNLGT